ncbi:TadE/TadG family type IV pilus assembly protein [Bradyrhizobium sp. BWC-3-1]|uniref:TadE/TadG family type IV pilus assembly protein n=1 Tax=Bradyrhizobium sp. BWC-3-1 TaxID=3080012 RepID=UPI00293F2F3F|nr:TadE/TadG family type IV pilus assembly protein [Bradyrhizobium sp. BWC-3-1]WOH56042.1 TadE/TadG family type IV pilus assembly protein [Bradyrhizobium sp. BWC-3-1]
MFTRSFATVWRDDKGSVLVEATILMPFLVTLMFGLFEFSWYFHKQQLVESGVRDAARYLARTAQDTSPPTDPCGNATFVANAKKIAVNGAVTGGAQRVTGWTAANVTITCSGFDNSAATYQGPSTVTIITASTNFADPALGYFSLLKLTTPNLSATHAERSIGPG